MVMNFLFPEFEKGNLGLSYLKTNVRKDDHIFSGHLSNVLNTIMKNTADIFEQEDARK